jgi:hypothetical protein
MDWPLTGAVVGVTALAGVVVYGAITVLRPAPAPAKKASPLPSLVWVAPRADSVVSGAPRSSPNNILALDGLTPAEPEPLAQSPRLPSRPSGSAPNSASAANSASIPNSATIPAPARTRPSGVATANLTAPPEPRKPAIPLNLSAPETTFQPSKEIRRYDGVLTPSEISRVRNTLRLTADQQPYWPPVEAALREIGRQQMAQVNSGKKAEVEASSVQRLYLAAQPLIGIMRPDQKEQVRRLARSLGYASYASMI